MDNQQNENQQAHQNFNRPPPQPNYNQGVYNPNQTSVVTVGEWMVTILLMIIPLVNIVMLFVWAFSGGPKVSRANWAKATLIWFLIMLIFYILIIVIVGGALLSNFL